MHTQTEAYELVARRPWWEIKDAELVQVQGGMCVRMELADGTTYLHLIAPNPCAALGGTPRPSRAVEERGEVFRAWLLAVAFGPVVLGAVLLLVLGLTAP